MLLQITNAGVSLLNQGGVFALTHFELGDSSNYIPDLDANQLTGNVVFSGSPGQPFPMNSNVVRYSMLLDRSVGDFDFGELGLYVDNVLVAIGVGNYLVEKTETATGTDGNVIRIDAFLSMVGNNYEMWMNMGDTDNRYVMSSVESVDTLPQVHNTLTNAYVVGAPTSDMQAFFAYTDRRGLWAFDVYKYSTTIDHRFTILSASFDQVTIDGTDRADDLRPSSLGHRIVQFVTGNNYSACRNIDKIIINPSNHTTTIIFKTALALVPAIGDEFVVYNRDPLASTSINIPIATKHTPGIIIVGDGLAVELDGLTSVDRETIPGGIVYSIAGKDDQGNPVLKQGDVVLTVQDIVDSVISVNGQFPDGGGNITISNTYTLPIATDTVLGGVRVSPGSGLEVDGQTGHLSIIEDYFEGILTINGRQPGAQRNLEIVGLIDPEDKPNVDFNTLTRVGLYCVNDVSSVLNGPTQNIVMKPGVCEVIPVVADQSILIQRWTQADRVQWRRVGPGAQRTPWFDVSEIQRIATDTDLGSVIIGDGLKVTVGGKISTIFESVNGKTYDEHGEIILTALDVNAIPYPEKGAHGGVASLDSDPSPTDILYNDYVYGRIARDMEALDSLTFKGAWDADDNSLAVTVAGKVLTWRLRDGGMIEATDGNDTTTYSGKGSVIIVSNPGNTTIDSNTNWQTGEVLMGFPGEWLRFTPVPPVPLLDIQISSVLLNAISGGALLFFHPVTERMSLTGAGPHLAVCRIPPSDDVELSIVHENNPIGVIKFVDGDEQGTVVISTDTVFEPEDMLEITSPNDTHGLMGLSFTLTFQKL